MARQHLAERDIGHPKPGDDVMRRPIVSAIEAAALERVDAIILYGSRARGDHLPDSDYDVFVLVSEKADLKQERQRIGDALGTVITQAGFRVSPAGPSVDGPRRSHWYPAQHHPGRRATDMTGAIMGDGITAKNPHHSCLTWSVPTTLRHLA
jgi:hypothetical protein